MDIIVLYPWTRPVFNTTLVLLPLVQLVLGPHNTLGKHVGVESVCQMPKQSECGRADAKIWSTGSL